MSRHEENNAINENNWKWQLSEIIKKWASDFGGLKRNPDEEGKANEEGNYILRNNIHDSKNKPFIGLIRPNEAPSGAYKDLSLVFFLPNSAEDNELSVIVGLACGSGEPNLQEDVQLAQQPGTRRLFSRLCEYHDNNTTDVKYEIKTQFTNFNASIWPDLKDNQKNSYNDNKKAYGKYCLAIRYVELDRNEIKEAYDKCRSTENRASCTNKGAVDDENRETKSLDLLRAFVALYANMRQWPKNGTIRQKCEKAYLKYINRTVNSKDTQNEVLHLCETRKYVVLQGAPGTGKTYTAKQIAKELTSNNTGKESGIFFTQFHAETTYSDFVHGIRPCLVNESKEDSDRKNTNMKSQQAEAAGQQDEATGHLGYRSTKGPLVNAIRFAMDNKNKKAVLIVDEINRANLSNVLGEVFYLFEPTMKDSNVTIELDTGLKLASLPTNFYCIATMNTADRSLAVVDFALRRRFAWYTIRPHKLNKDELESGQYFCENVFNEFSNIFQKYASEEELNLQPGQSYFITNEKPSSNHLSNAMILRLKYELLPLIKEYLDSGLMGDATQEFDSLFRAHIGTGLYI